MSLAVQDKNDENFSLLPTDSFDFAVLPKLELVIKYVLPNFSS